MAKYDKEFLTTYLTDLYALHLADRKLTNIIEEKKWTVERLERGTKVKAPDKPHYERPIGCLSILSILVGAFMAIGIAACILTGNYPSDWPAIFPILAFAIGAAMVFFPAKVALEIKSDNDAACRAYQAAFSVYEKNFHEARKMNEKARTLVPKVVEQIAFYEQEREAVADLLNQLYDVNVIPMRYRDMYAVVYLYDYFTHSREDDLSIALNTYVLEQIKDKIDQIIERQSEMILNQRIQTALQYRTMEEQRKFAASMERKAEALTASVDEQKQYLSMIEANTAATAYFMAADYFRD